MERGTKNQIKSLTHTRLNHIVSEQILTEKLYIQSIHTGNNNNDNQRIEMLSIIQQTRKYEINTHTQQTDRRKKM